MATPIKKDRGVLVHDEREDRIPGLMVGADYEGFWFLSDSFPTKSERFSYADGWAVKYPKPELPTERGSVILDVLTEYGDRFSSAYQYAGGTWLGVRGGRDDWGTVLAPSIVEFTPAKVVAA